MNVAYPKSGFKSDAAAVQGFIDLLTSGFENPDGIDGSVLVTIPERPEQSFIARYGDMLRIEREDITLPTTAQITMPIATIHRIFREYEYLDWRDPDIIGTVTVKGSLPHANRLAMSCIRPSNRTMARFRRAERLHRARGYRDLTTVAHLHRPTQRQILEMMAQSRPAVITGLDAEKPCRDWTIDRLAARYGDTVVRVRSATQRQTMAEFVADLKGARNTACDEGAKPYTEGAALPKAMWPDFGPLFFDREDFIPPQLWLGAVPTHVPTTSLHRDLLTGFLFQVIGRKRLDLYSADQAALLYPKQSYNNYQPCWFRPDAPDYDRYPKARAARCLSVTLNPGELLVQPAGWFHQVYALDSPNMSVSHFWRY